MKTASLMLPFLALLSLAGCGNVEDCANGARDGFLSPNPLSELSRPCYGGCIVTGTIGDASVLLPILAGDAPSRDLGLLMFNGLLKYDKNARIVGDLAERWELSEDKLRLRFHLRKGIHWHDGRPLTSRDVEYTYQLYRDPNTPTPWAADFLKVDSFRRLDDHVAEVSYKEPYAPALDSWTEAILPRHLLEGEHIAKCTLQRSPVGTGPYRFERWKTGEKIILKANSHYFEGKPYIGRIVIRVVPDPATMFLLLKAGEIDRMDLTPLQYARMTDTDWFKNHFRKYKFLHWGYTYLGYNLQDPKFKDRKVRQAITMAINRERIVQGVLLGHGVVAHTPYKPDTIWYNSRVKKFPYRPDRAKKLLAEAGWTDVNGDGILQKDGVPFEFTIVTNHGNELRRNAAVLIQHDLKEIGIQVHIRVIEWAALLKNFLHKRDFEACLLGWRVGIDPNQIDVWDSSRTCERCLNFVGYSNTEVDRLLQLGASTFDVQERKGHYDKFQEILAEDQPCTFLWVQEDLPIINGRFCGIEPAPLGIDYNFNLWYVPKLLQRTNLRP